MNKNLRSFTIKPFLAAIVIAPILLGGCAATSTQYQRQNAAKGEIVWAYDRELKATRDSMIICGDNWDGLSEAVSRVPEAKSIAESARNNHTTGLGLRWSGIAVIIGGTILGLVTLNDEFKHINAESSSSPSSYSGFWIMMGGVTFGASISGYGNYLIQQGTADAIDAFNIYNCKIENNTESKK